MAVGCHPTKEAVAVDSEQREVRLVVTGHDRSGRGGVVRDEGVGPRPGLAADGWQAYILWGADAVQCYPDSGRNASFGPTMPQPGGVRLVELVVYPKGKEPLTGDPTELQAITKEHSADSAMHFTPSYDLIVVLEGEVVLELDDGRTVLRQGDYLVQNGTRHAWHNLTDTPARLGVIVVGAEHRGF